MENCLESPGLDVGSPGSPSKMDQWSKMHCGKACPPVPDLRAAVKPSKVEPRTLMEQKFDVEVGRPMVPDDKRYLIEGLFARLETYINVS